MNSQKHRYELQLQCSRPLRVLLPPLQILDCLIGLRANSLAECFAFSLQHPELTRFYTLTMTRRTILFFLATAQQLNLSPSTLNFKFSLDSTKTTLAEPKNNLLRTFFKEPNFFTCHTHSLAHRPFFCFFYRFFCRE